MYPACNPMHPACNPMHPACNPMHPACNPMYQPERAWQIYEWANAEGLLPDAKERANALDLAIAAVLPPPTGGSGRGEGGGSGEGGGRGGNGGRAGGEHGEWNEFGEWSETGERGGGGSGRGGGGGAGGGGAGWPRPPPSVLELERACAAYSEALAEKLPIDAHASGCAVRHTGLQP